jgi:integrase
MTKMNVTRKQLVELQQAIAAGHPPALTKPEEWYWHERMRLAIRLYKSGSAKWVVKYYNERGLERSHTIGSPVVLTVSQAEDAAKKILGKVAHKEDPQGDRQKLRAKPKLTLRAMCLQYCDEMERSRKKAQRTVYNYRNNVKNHLGSLGNLQADEVTRADISNRIRGIENEPLGKRGSPGGGANTAHQVRSMLSTVYGMALKDGIVDENPVIGSRRVEPAEVKTKPEVLTLDELGAIWRACETMAKESPPRLGGNPWGARRPTPASSIRADSALLTLSEAARQSGLDKSIFDHAIQDGIVKATLRRDLPNYEEHPLKIKRGYTRRTYLISGAELRRFTESRDGQMRSPQFEYSAIIRLLILLGSRYSEIAGLRWDETDPDNGIIHIKTVTEDGQRRVKSRGGKKKDLILFLPQLAIDILRTVPERPGACLFGNNQRKISNRGALGPRSRQRVPWARTGLLQSSDHKELLDQTILKNGDTVRPWKIHWLRHTFTTGLNAMKVEPRVIESITNHLSEEAKIRLWGGESVPEMSGHYNQAQYPIEQREVLTKWADKIHDAAKRKNRVHRLPIKDHANDHATRRIPQASRSTAKR